MAPGRRRACWRRCSRLQLEDRLAGEVRLGGHWRSWRSRSRRPGFAAGLAANAVVVAVEPVRVGRQHRKVREFGNVVAVDVGQTRRNAQVWVRRLALRLTFRRCLCGGRRDDHLGGRRRFVGRLLAACYRRDGDDECSRDHRRGCYEYASHCCPNLARGQSVRPVRYHVERSAPWDCYGRARIRTRADRHVVWGHRGQRCPRPSCVAFGSHCKSRTVLRPLAGRSARPLSAAQTAPGTLARAPPGGAGMLRRRLSTLFGQQGQGQRCCYPR
jgi:hypothetical protein